MPDINATVTGATLTNAVMGRIYDVLTNGDDTVPKSADNFFSWMTPGVPFDPTDFDFLVQGLTGVVRAQDVANLVVPGSSVGGSASSSSSGTATSSTSSSTSASGSGASSGSPSSGQVLTPDLINQLRAQDTNRVYMQAEMVASLCDFVPEVSKSTNNQFAQFTVANNEGTLSDRYQLVLQMSQVMAQQLDDATKANIARFRSLLQTTTTQTDLVTGAQTQVTGPSPLVTAYNTKMAAYNAAALQYNSARIAALAGTDPTAVQTWAINAGILRDQVQAAMNDWITNGYKVDYEEMAAYIAQVQQRDMSLLKAQYEDDLTTAQLTGISSGGTFYYTALIPGTFAQSQSGWSDFSFYSGDIHRYAGSSYSASGWTTTDGGSFLGLFNVGATASGAQSHAQYQGKFDSQNTKVNFKIAQIPIVRHWFKEGFITSSCWRFDQSNPDFKGRMICDGGTPPNGYLAAYPTSALFVRDLTIDFGQYHSDVQAFLGSSSSSVGGGGTACIGPFCIGGSASHWSKNGYASRNQNASWSGSALTVPGLQLIGFRCHIFPKAPNPDPGIKAWV